MAFLWPNIAYSRGWKEHQPGHHNATTSRMYADETPDPISCTGIYSTKYDFKQESSVVFESEFTQEILSACLDLSHAPSMKDYFVLLMG